MKRQSWDNLTLSAYVDGQLANAEREALEAALARDATLRARVEALRATVALLHAAPLREPSRNYRLTPALVTAPQGARRNAPARRSMPLLFTRWATAFTAAAFILVLGLQLNLGGMANFSAAPQAQPVALERGFADDSQTEEALQAAPPEAAPQDVHVEAPLFAAPVATACAPESNCDEMTSLAAAPEIAGDSVNTRTLAPEIQTSPLPLPAPATPEQSAPQAAAPAPTLFPMQWFTIGLGLLTLTLAGFSMWLARRR